MKRLPNYLRSNRKRLALSQDEVAFLLGSRSGAKTSRHEHFSRQPSLATALAYEVIYARPVKELFGGLYRIVEKKVIARAIVLKHRIHRGKPTGAATRKHRTFVEIAAGQSNPASKR